MKFTMRSYQTEEDYWRIREFLRQVFLLNGRREVGWHVATFDYTRWHMYQNCFGTRPEDVISLWATLSGQIVAVLLPIDPGSAHLQVHPGLRTLALEEEMLAVAEERLALREADGSRRLTVWAHAGDTLRQELLTRHGYARGDGAEHTWRRYLDKPIPDAPLPPGYSVRSLGDGLEFLERCYASGLGFHDGDIRVAVNNRSDPTWYRNIQNAPLYRRDLDLVAVAPGGAIASFCTVWFDDVTRSGIYEPVATVPEHQRRGLARAVITEGLRRLQRMGAVVASVGGFSPAANALYSSVMSLECEVLEPWVKG